MLTIVMNRHIIVFMKQTFWEKVRISAKALGVPDATFRKWKSRGGVPSKKAIEIHLYSIKTKNKIGLSEFPQPVTK